MAQFSSIAVVKQEGTLGRWQFWGICWPATQSPSFHSLACPHQDPSPILGAGCVSATPRSGSGTTVVIVIQLPELSGWHSVQKATRI